MSRPQKLYTMSRKAEREAMAARLAEHLARVDGVAVTNKPHEYDAKRIGVAVEAGGVRASIDLDGDSTWGIFANWNFDYKTRAGRLFSREFQAALSLSLAGRPHHKATGPFMGHNNARTPIQEMHIDVFAATINRAMRKVLDGSAFVQEVARQSA